MKTSLLKETASPIAYSKWNNRFYHALLTPKADSGEIAALGERLIFHHGSPTKPDSGLIVAERGVITAGWVLGIFEY